MSRDPSRNDDERKRKDAHACSSYTSNRRANYFTQAEAFARAAISEAEKEFEQLGSRFAKVRKTEQGFQQDSDRVYQRPFSPPAIKFSQKPAKETFDEYKARLTKEWEAQNQ